jgi:lysophospholipase L1-like esterase
MKKNLIFCLAFLMSLFHISGQTVKQKIACVGNSITFGYLLSSPATQSYPAQMQALLGTTNWDVGNFGVSSRTMLKKGDKPYWNEPAYTNSKNFLPHFVMIELGTNDAKTTNWNPYGKEFNSNYKEMIQVFQGLSSKPEVWIGLIPPGQYVKWDILFGYVKDSVNTRIKQIAIESGVGLIDVFDALNGNATNWFSSTYFQTDSIHPKVAGAAIIAQKVKEMITMPKPQITYQQGILSIPQANGYQWYLNNSLIPANEGGTQREFTPAKKGTYKVSVKLNSTNETRIISREYVLSDLFSNLEKTVDNRIKIYPNPTVDGTIKIEIPSGANDFQVSIFNLSGSILFKSGLYSDKEYVDISHLKQGNYLIKISNDKSDYSLKLIKAI